MNPREAEALEKFGRLIVAEVYDRSCEYLQGVISHGMKGIKPDPLFVAYRALDSDDAAILRRFLVEAVDQTFAQFLHFLDVHEISVPIEASGQHVDVRAASDGLAAEPYNESGWLAKYSRYKDGITPLD